MFLPGFVTGRLIQRFGAHPIICIGAALTALCVATNLLFPPLLATFMVALALLGIGWNFMFVGGTTLLAAAHDPHERVRVQATNDFIVFSTVACTAFASGAIEAIGGWTALNLVVLPPTVIAAALVIWHRFAQSRLAPAAAQ
jgi:MFS family permease